MQVVLAMFRSDGDRRSFSLHKETTVVGRREDCDLRIPLGEISRKHCKITKNGEGLKVEDLGSSNGTYHNGQRVQEAIVQPGDTVQVGSVAFVVQIDGVPGDEELQPVLAQKSKSDDSGTRVAQAEDSGSPQADGEAVTEEEPVAAAEGEPEGDGEFDPLAFLEGGDSQASGGAIAIDPDASGLGGEAES
ncbi:MAG TPA: FHA domain-containing protein [Tepidisphaeraceae bacterium]|nr:FHA domain-containing protein [Tepidisphaeraceae bacterium]